MCKFFGVSRSGYYAFVHRLGRPEQDAALAEVIAKQRERSFRTCGYRRMWLWLKKQDIFCNPKTVLRIIKKYDLQSEIRCRWKWQQMGKQVHKYKICSTGRFTQTGPTASGNGYFLHPYKAGGTVPVHDPGSLREQHRGL